jgi:hypothetical protein
MYRNVERKIFPQHKRRVPSQGDSSQHTANAEEENCSSFPWQRSLRYAQREQDIGRDSSPPKQYDQEKRAMIASL